MIFNINRVYEKLCQLMKKVTGLEAQIKAFECPDITDTFSVAADNGDGTWTITNVDGSVVTISSGNVVENPDGSFTFTFPGGSTRTVSPDTNTFSTAVENADGSVTITNVDGSEVTTSVNTDTWVDWVENDDRTATFTDPDGNSLNVCVECSDIPQYINISSEVSDPTNPNDPIFNCTRYNIGDYLFIGSNSFCPDFLYLVLSDGAGGCEIKLITKPDGATINTGG